MVHFNQFSSFLKAELGLCEATSLAYISDLRDLAGYIYPLSLENATLYSLKTYLQALAQKGIEASTQARRVSAMRCFYRFLHAEGLCKEDLASMLERPILPFKAIMPPSQAIMANLLDHAKRCAENSPQGVRLWAVLELLYGGGLRISEALTLPQDAIMGLHSCKPAIYIKGKGGRERMVPLTSLMESALKEYQKVREQFIRGSTRAKLFVFGSNRAKSGYFTRQTLFLQLKALAKQGGGYELSPHSLRHSFATHLLQEGVDVMAVKTLLGHKHVRSTQVYTHIMDKEKMHVFLRCHPLQAKNTT